MSCLIHAGSLAGWLPPVDASKHLKMSEGYPHVLLCHTLIHIYIYFYMYIYIYKCVGMYVYVHIHTDVDKHGDTRCHEGFPHGGVPWQGPHCH